MKGTAHFAAPFNMPLSAQQLMFCYMYLIKKASQLKRHRTRKLITVYNAIDKEIYKKILKLSCSCAIIYIAKTDRRGSE